ncbi:MAG: hypothetical protein EKK39_03065 [Sphingobacteriales bacterium]|uniref:DUF6702 family protein n=1 Tax=Hydrotalea flava TaxID=714549 RepID=UPI00082A20AE|nr:DUF6702 family protein [Hydrotalea flava]RTL55050.1 MAG: hypothetical protein EKK39_03065 [Sphingobacteriales bacterium]
MVALLYKWIWITYITAMHPFYVSVIDLHHNAKEKMVEVSIRIFTDDLEQVLKKHFNKNVDLTLPANKAEVDNMIQQYISQKMNVTINNARVHLKYIGYEIQKESVWSYFEIDNIPSIKKMDITSTLLYDYQPTQVNIFHVNCNGEDKSYKLDNPQNAVSFIF